MSGALRKALERLVKAKALCGVRELVAGWNGEGRPDGPYQRHPASLGATLPKTTCGAVYDLDEAMQEAHAALAASPADVVGEIVAWLTFQAEGLERCAADERRFQPDRDEAALVAKELRWRIEHIASRFSTGDGWTLVAGNPPCAVGEQADVEFCSPGWACAHFGMVTNFGDHLDWSLYDQINDKFVSWASETPKFYRLRVPLPAPGETDAACLRRLQGGKDG